MPVILMIACIEDHFLHCVVYLLDPIEKKSPAHDSARPRLKQSSPCHFIHVGLAPGVTNASRVRSPHDCSFTLVRPRGHCGRDIPRVTRLRPLWTRTTAIMDSGVLSESFPTNSHVEMYPASWDGYLRSLPTTVLPHCEALKRDSRPRFLGKITAE